MAHKHNNHAAPRLLCITLTLLTLSASPNILLADTIVDPLEPIVNALATDDLTTLEPTITALAAVPNPRRLILLKAIRDGALYYRKDDKRVVLATANEAGYELADAVSGAPGGTAGTRDVRKIPINNTLREQLQGVIARLSLQDPDTAVRLAAVQDIIGDLTPETLLLLRDARNRETAPRVLETIDTGLAIAALEQPDRPTQLAAINTLSRSLLPQARQALARLLEHSTGVEPDAEMHAAATKAQAEIDAKLKVNAIAENVFFGLSLGSVLLLAAIGLAITFGVKGVINMAHGELMMLGAYTTYVIQQLMPTAVEWSLLVAIPAAFIVAGLVGIAIERGVIRHLYGRPLETLLATFGISLILQQLVRSVFSPLNRSVVTPEWMSGSWEINAALSFTYTRLYIVAFSLLIFFALWLVLRKTSLGLHMRAVSQNRSMARAMGVRSDRVDALTFGLGSGIAGVAGVALSQLTNVGPNLGQAYIIDSFMVVVFGGVGNLWGTLVGAMSLGVVNKFLEPWSGAVLAKIVVLVFIILFIQKRPRGLFPQQGRVTEH